MEKLKPCPFCGRNGQVYEPESDGIIFSAQCEMGGCIKRIGYYYNKLDAIEA